MSLNKGKHIVTDLEGIRCTVVESGLSEQRMIFLSELLKRNGYEVKKEMEKSKEGTSLGTYIVGVADLIFNPVIAVYQKKLFRENERIVSPAYWNQWPVDTDLPYWQVKLP
jgi:hypothetical protein